MPLRVFISHAHSDGAAAAHALACALEARSAECFASSRDHDGSQNWLKNVAHQFDRAEAVVVLLTPNALLSDNVLTEVQVATQYADRKLVSAFALGAPLPSSTAWQLALRQQHVATVSSVDEIVAKLWSQFAKRAGVLQTLPHVPRPEASPTASAPPDARRSAQDADAARQGLQIAAEALDTTRLPEIASLSKAIDSLTSTHSSPFLTQGHLFEARKEIARCSSELVRDLSLFDVSARPVETRVAEARAQQREKILMGIAELRGTWLRQIEKLRFTPRAVYPDLSADLDLMDLYRAPYLTWLRRTDEKVRESLATRRVARLHESVGVVVDAQTRLPEPPSALLSSELPSPLVRMASSGRKAVPSEKEMSHFGRAHLGAAAEQTVVETQAWLLAHLDAHADAILAQLQRRREGLAKQQMALDLARRAVDNAEILVFGRPSTPPSS